jgi:opacity protein-like surface antigen
MRSFCRRLIAPVLASAAVCGMALPAAAQGFGVGARIAFVKADVDGDDDAVRFIGGHIRLTGERAGLEVSIDRHTETFELLGERVKETPVQVSGLLFLARGAFKPYLLAGPGWYKKSIESIDGLEPDVSTREFGWHGGFGAEIRGGRHFGVHADYRYTRLSFDDDDDDEPGAAGLSGNNSFISGLLPSHDGSMWTVGVTVYF